MANDYSGAFSTTTPAQSFTQGLDAGNSLQQMQMDRMQQAMKLARSQSFWNSSQQVAANPTLQNVAQLSLAYPEMAAQLRTGFDMLQPAQQQGRLQTAIPIYAAMESGRYDVASNLLRQQAAALQNSGQNDEAQHASQMADLVDSNPGHAHMAAGLMLASALGPDKFQSTFGALPAAQTGYGSIGSGVQKNQAEADIASANALTQLGRNQAEIGQINANVANQAGRLQLDRDQLMSNTQTKLRELNLQYGTPDDESRKQINDAAVSAATGEQSASRLTDLAGRIDQVDAAGRANGRISDWGEIGRQVYGGQDAISALKQEYARLVNNQALSQTKDALGGRVTDVDMKAAMSTVPSASASPAVVTSYLRGVAKIQQVQAAMDQARAEWLSQAGYRGNLGPAKTDLYVQGTRVPAGTTYADFIQKFAEQKAAFIAKQSAASKAVYDSILRPQGAPPTAASQAAGAPMSVGSNLPGF